MLLEIEVTKNEILQSTENEFAFIIYCCAGHFVLRRMSFDLFVQFIRYDCSVLRDQQTTHERVKMLLNCHKLVALSAALIIKKPKEYVIMQEFGFHDMCAQQLLFTSLCLIFTLRFLFTIRLNSQMKIF